MYDPETDTYTYYTTTDQGCSLVTVPLINTVTINNKKFKVKTGDLTCQQTHRDVCAVSLNRFDVKEPSQFEDSQGTIDFLYPKDILLFDVDINSESSTIQSQQKKCKKELTNYCKNSMMHEICEAIVVGPYKCMH